MKIYQRLNVPTYIWDKAKLSPKEQLKYWERNKTLEEQRIWEEETDNLLRKRNKTAFVYKTKEIKPLIN